MGRVTMENLFRCPDCHNRIKKKFFSKTLKECRCGYVVRQENGLFYLNAHDESWLKCEVEKDGWISLNKEIGLYIDNEDHFYLPDGKPHLIEFFGEAKRGLDKLLELENFNSKVCLDLGAGYAWAECYLQKYVNAKFIALECNDDKLVGLGRSEAMKRHYNVDFMSIVGDMHNIPLVDNSVDIVFAVGALHHFSDLKKVMEESHRVLKRGGSLWAVCEPLRDDGVNEIAVSREYAPLEHKHGIIERRPTRQEYLEAGKVLNLEILNEQLNYISPGLILHGIKK